MLLRSRLPGSRLLLFITLSVLTLPAYAQPAISSDPDTGLAIDQNWQQVRAVCTVCHSAKLVTQNRMSRSAWLDTIRWMQKEHGLIPLNDLEEPILDYLGKHYNVPDNIRTRRRNLTVHQAGMIYR